MSPASAPTAAVTTAAVTSSAITTASVQPTSTTTTLPPPPPSARNTSTTIDPKYSGYPQLSVLPQTARSGITTTTVTPGTEFMRYINGFGGVLYELRRDPATGFPATPYFAVGRLIAAYRGEERDTVTFLIDCGTLPKNPRPGINCAVTHHSRGVLLDVHILDARRLPTPGWGEERFIKGTRIEIDFNSMAYTGELDRQFNDLVAEKVIESAPIGQTFAMFIAPSLDRWLVADWAIVDRNGQLLPIGPGDGPAWRSFGTLDAVLAKIAAST